MVELLSQEFDQDTDSFCLKPINTSFYQHQYIVYILFCIATALLLIYIPMVVNEIKVEADQGGGIDVNYWVEINLYHLPVMVIFLLIYHGPVKYDLHP